MRPIWKAEVRVGSEHLPVRLYPALRDRRVHFRLLHAEDLAPVEARMVDPETGSAVPPEEIRRGVEVEPGTFVIIDDEERRELEPRASRRIEIVRVVDRREMALAFFERPYHLGPDGDTDGYFALAEALDEKAVVCVARWTMRKRRHVGAIRADRGYLVLETLREAGRLVHLAKVSPPASRTPTQREQALARQVIESLEEPFDPTHYENEHRAKLLALVDAKASGRVVRIRETKEPRRRGPLADQLEASLRASRRSHASR